MKKVLSFLAGLIGFHYVPENYKAAVTRFGMYYRARGPGFIWVVPFVERVENLVKVGMRFAAFRIEQVSSSDGFPFDFGLTVFYSFDPDSTSRPIAAQLVGLPDHVLEGVVKDYIDKSLRRTVALYRSEDITKGDTIADIEQSVIKPLRAQVRHLGLNTMTDGGVVIKEIIPPKELTKIRLEVIRQALIAEALEETRKDSLEIIIRTDTGTVVSKRYWQRFNPYKPGPPIREPYLFFGRQKTMQTLLDGLRELHFAVHGERRIGKTSLLRQLERRLPELTHPTYLFVPVFVQLQRVPEAELFQRLIRLVFEVVRQHTGPLSLVADEGGTGYDDVDFTDDLETIIEAVRQRRGKEARIVLLLDEGDRLNEYSRDTQKRLRGVLMEKLGLEHLRLVWSGLVITPIKDDTSPWYNLFASTMVLAPFDRETAVRLITEPVKGIYQYDEAAINLILGQSGSRPYEVQALCHAVIEHVKHRISGQKVSPPVQVTADDVKAVAQQRNQGPKTESRSHHVAESQSEYRTADGGDE